MAHDLQAEKGNVHVLVHGNGVADALGAVADELGRGGGAVAVDGLGVAALGVLDVFLDVVRPMTLDHSFRVSASAMHPELAKWPGRREVSLGSGVVPLTVGVVERVVRSAVPAVCVCQLDERSFPDLATGGIHSDICMRGRGPLKSG